jgi:hypothetical protein
MFCKEINLPLLNAATEQRLIDCFFKHIDLSQHPVSDSISNYRNLYSFENKEDFFKSIFLDSLNPDYFQYMSIQRTTGKTFPAHRDVHRKVTALYTLRGSASTVFYNIHNGRLFEVERVQMTLGKWYLFDNSSLHGVEDIFDDRISLVIDFTSLYTNFQEALKVFL